MKTMNKTIVGIALFIAAILFAVVIMLLGHLIELLRDNTYYAALPLIIIYVEGGLVQSVYSTEPGTEVILFDQDNIEAGDRPPISDKDMTTLTTDATAECFAEIKKGKFFQVF